MKKILLCLVFITSIAQLSNAQTGISAAGTAPDASAMLDVIATDKGMLVPRVLLTATNTAGPIATPATGLLVYNTNTAGVAPNNVIPGFYYNSGTTVAPNWVRIISGNGSSNDAIMNQSAAVQNPGTFWIQGVGRVGDGTAAAPGLSFNSSANTGVFLPAATQLGLSTAGAERMRVDANGNVGIGTTGPESIFHIEKNASGAMGGDLVLTNKVSATNTAVAIDFGVDNSTTANGAGNAQIKVINMDGTNQKSDMTFSTWNGSAFGERMRIASNGNIGIGSATPAYKLDVVGDTKTSGKFFGHLNVDDTRAANTAPTGYNNEVAFDFKQISVLNSAPGSGTYGGLITMAPWGDNSGDASHQLLFNEGGIYWRQGQPDAAAWDAWSQVLTTSAGGAGTPNYLARWITANSLGIGATQDDGTNVGIGTAPATYKLSVAGNARFTNGAGSYVYVGSGGGAYYADAANTVVHTPAGGSFYMANVGTDGTKVAQSDGTLRVGGPSQGSANLYVYGSAGIGNTGPAEKLDVTGNIKATGVVYWGNGLTRTETRDDAGSQGGRSGFYETSVPAPAANWYTGASSWQHLMETRHSNTGNNYAMQIAGGFFDQDFWVRKTNNSATTAWSKMLTTSNIGTSAIQNQYTSAQTASFWVNGNAQIGSTFTNLNGRLLTSNQGGWQADGVTPQMVISANSASTNRAALIGLDLHNDNTTNNVYAPFITFSRRSNGTAYNSAFASIGAQVTGQGTDANWCAGDLIFSTENGTVNGMGERMRIDKSGRVYILQNQGNDPNFAGLDDPTSANGRAQLVLSSSYSDLVIASSEGNDNHGSTLTFASYNPGNSADYRKFVINQGNWGARFGYLDFGFADAGGRSNPHANINGTDNVITLNGINKRLGVGIMSPAQTLDVNGKARIRRGVNTMGGNANEGQLEIANTGSGDAYISFHREGAWGAHFGLGADNWFSTYGWSPGTWNALRVGAFEARGGGAFAGSAYNRDWGVGAGTTYGKVYSNLDNQVNGGLTISDDGGFYDYNDGWLQSQGSNGIMYNTSSGTYFSLYRTDRPGCCYDKQIIPQNANWGYVGTGGNYWFRMYAGAFVNGSTRESKRNITPLDESTYEVVMNDIDKIKPSFYKYNEELDDLTEGHETKYRPNYHLGVITDQSPDYIQDEAFAGIDIYAIATLGLAGVKYNRAEIKEIKETLGMTEETTRLQDFGSFVMNGNEITVPFRNSFSSKLNNSVMPVVTLTANKTDVTLAISYKDSKGFKVIASGNTNGLMVDYIAFAEVTNYSNPQKTEVSHQIMKGLVVDENIKNTIHRYWAKQKEDLEKSIVPGSKPDYVPSEPLEK